MSTSYSRPSSSSIAVHEDCSNEKSYVPHQMITNQNVNPNHIWRSARRSMADRGYQTAPGAMATTLQGSLWAGLNTNKNTIGHFSSNIVVKVTNKDLDFQKITVLDGKSVKIEESIISEMKILKYLTRHGMLFIANYIDFFHDETNYYLVMENGGKSLFDFVLKAHQFISAGKLSPFQWQTACKSIFKQMVTFLDVLHNAMAVCHLDISLENVLINDVLITIDATNGSIRFVSQFKIKFIDFGLSEMFDPISNPNFLCNKWVGKSGYQSPELFEKKANFSAKASDIWSLGVCLFALLIGNMPYHKPSMSDPYFPWIMSGRIVELINEWGKSSCIRNSLAPDILSRIFTLENKRITAKQLLP
eukprot:176536_1